jgi:hypothetical protein
MQLAKGRDLPFVLNTPWPILVELDLKKASMLEGFGIPEDLGPRMSKAASMPVVQDFEDK